MNKEWTISRNRWISEGEYNLCMLHLSISLPHRSKLKNIMGHRTTGFTWLDIYVERAHKAKWRPVSVIVGTRTKSNIIIFRFESVKTKEAEMNLSQHFIQWNIKLLAKNISSPCIQSLSLSPEFHLQWTWKLNNWILDSTQSNLLLFSVNWITFKLKLCAVRSQ